MNERIKELVKQVAPSFGENQKWAIVGEADIEKFAELVVRECEKSIKSVPTHFEAQDKIVVECLKSIRETFRN